MIGISDLDSHINSIDFFSTIYIINDFSDLSMDICNYKVRNLTKFSFFLVGLIINGFHQNFLNIVVETTIVFLSTHLEPFQKIFTESKGGLLLIA